MTDIKEVLVRATRDQIIDFKESILWKDMKRELGIWKRGCTREYDEVISNTVNGSENTASTLMLLGDIHGRKKTIDYLIAMPDVFLQILEDRKDDSGRNETDGSGAGESAPELYQGE